MYDDYQLRKDIDRIITFLDNLEKLDNSDDGILAILKGELSKYYDSSEVDVVTEKLNGDLTELRSSLGDLTDGLVEFNGELIAFDESNTNLKGDLSKLKQNLQKFTAAVNKLKVDLNGLDEKSEEFGEDLWGEEGLDERLTSLGLKIGNDDSGLIKDLNELDEYTKGFYDDVYGTNGLSTQLTTLEGVINNPTTGLAAQLTGLDSKVFGANGLSERIFGTNGLASRIGTAEGGLSNLTDSLDTLVDFLTNFEGTLDDFEEALEEDSNIDTSELNSSITALLGLIAGVKKDVDVVDGNLTDVSDSFNGVKSNLYGTKTVTIDGETVTVPKDPSDSPSPTSLRGHLDTLKDTTVPAVQNTLYGGEGNSPSSPSANSLMGKTNAVKADLYGSTNGVPNDPSNASSNSFKTTIEHLRDTTVPAVQGEIFGTDSQGNPLNSTNYSDDSILGKSDELKSDMYGTKTVNGQTVPKEKTDTPDSNSVKGLINKVDNDINNQTTGLNVKVTGLESNIDTVSDGLDTANGHIGTIQGMMYGSDIEHPSDGSLMKKIDTAEGNITTVQGDITDLDTIVGTTTSKVQTDGSLQTQITYLPAYINRLFVTQSVNIDNENVNYSKINVGEIGYIVLAITELAKKIIRDNGSVTYTVYVTDPDNITTTLTRTQNYTSSSRQSISFTFSKVGLYVVACEHLKYVVWVGEEIPHTHKNNYAKIDANGIQLYVNDDVGIATLRIYETDKNFGSGTDAWYLTTNGNITQNSRPVVIPAGYRPLTSSVVLHTFGQSGMTGIVHTDGAISFLRGSTTGSQNIHAYGTWLF